MVGQLVQTDSPGPGAYKNQIEQWVHEWLAKEIEEKAEAPKNRVELIQKEVMPGRSSLTARIPGREEAVAPSPVYMCHMDAMMLGEGWEEDTPALGIVVKEDRLYGRGACDMKSGLACALSIFSGMAELVGSTGELPVRPFIFIGTTDEEDSVRGVECATRDGRVGREDWILDAKPADGQIQAAHKGRIWLELTMQGITVHTSNPWKDADIIVAMAEAVCHTRKAIGSCPVHKDLSMSMVTFGQITEGYRLYVIPSSCKVWINMRLVPPTGIAAAKNIAEETAKTVEAEIAGVRGSYIVTGDRPYVEKDNGFQLLVSLESVYDRVTGEDIYVGSFNGYMDTTAIAGTLGDHNCISYGPGSLELAHKPNEYVSYENVCRCGRVLTELVRQEAFFPFVL